MIALIVCHAGFGVGLGHLTRSLVVASALKHELGATVKFLIQGDPVHRDDLAQFNHHFISIDINLAKAIRNQVHLLGAQIVILDLYQGQLPVDIAALLKGLRQDGCRVIGVDCLIGHRSDLDLIFIPSFHFLQSEDYDGTVPILFGWDCFLLNVRSRAIQWKPGRQVLALAGGGDTTKLGRSLPTLLNAALPMDTTLHWVTGPYAQNPIWPEAPRFSMINHQPNSGLEYLMTEANYAITVYGVSLFELLYYGVPSVVFSPYGNKDDDDLMSIAAQGIAIVAKDELEAVTKLKELMSDDALAHTLSQRARQMLATPGGHKFAQAVAKLMA